MAAAKRRVSSAARRARLGPVHRYAGLALILVAGGDIERSDYAADQMLDRAVGVESGRIRDRIDTVITALCGRGGLRRGAE